MKKIVKHYMPDFYGIENFYYENCEFKCGLAMVENDAVIKMMLEHGFTVLGTEDEFGLVDSKDGRGVEKRALVSRLVLSGDVANAAMEAMA